MRISKFPGLVIVDEGPYQANIVEQIGHLPC